MEQTIGEQLKQARIKRGLSLDQVSQATHIRKHYLEALENDQRDTLPSPVQGRGFLRLYADFVGLSSADLLAVWEHKVSYASNGTNTPQSQSKEKTTPRNNATIDQRNEEGSDVDAQPTEEVVTASAEQSQAIFKEIGQTLRQQREALGLSLAEIERYTRLRQHYITALENGRIEDLPSPVQGRGMLSNYAAFLNLKEDAILLRFAEGLQARRVERVSKIEAESVTTPRKRPARQAPLWRRFLTPDLIFGIGILAIILFFALWTASRINAFGSDEVSPTPQDISSIILTPDVEVTENATASPTVMEEIAGDQVNATADSAEISASTEITSVDNPAVVFPTATAQPAGQTVENPGVATATLSPINNDPLQVYIVARQRAWLRVIADDKVKFLGRVVPGNAYAFSGSKRIELTTGNAAALQVFYNQTDLGTLGISGQAVGMVFASDGIMTPTPAFTATSTPTKPATVTPLPTMTPQPSPTITPFIPKDE